METDFIKESRQLNSPLTELSENPQLLYKTFDGFDRGPGSIIVAIVSILIFGAICIFAIYNTIKFYKHRSYALGLFYIFTVVNLIIRTLYFIDSFFTETSYLNTILLCSPAAFSCAIGLCQVMNYFVLYIRLNSYVRHREKEGENVEDQEMDQITRSEKFVTGLFTVIIFVYPLLILCFLIANAHDYEKDIIKQWERYELFYMINFICITILLVVSTFLTLNYMKKVFGEQSMKEEKPIKFMLAIFCSSYILRVGFAVMFHVRYEWVEHVFYQHNAYFQLAVFLLWMLWDAIPLLSMLIIHYKNFSSFENEEILFTEYTADQRDSTMQGYSMKDSVPHNRLEDSGVINLEESHTELMTEEKISVRSGSNAENLNRQKQNHTKQSIINKQELKARLEKQRRSDQLLKPAGVSQSYREETKALNFKHQTSNLPLAASQGEEAKGELFMRFSPQKQQIDKAYSGATSRTMSAGMLRWSLARSMNLGIVSVRIFRKEIARFTHGRKSTIDVKPRLLIRPESLEAQRMALNDSRRSRSAADLHSGENSSDSDSETI